jgi:tetratricopeptide (TPR) repeat protein
VEQALAHWRAAQDRTEEATSLFTIGLLYIEIADREKALQYTAEALTAAQSTLDQKIIGRALEAIGRVHNSFGDKRKAIEYGEQALPLLRAARDRAGEATALDNAGVAYSGRAISARRWPITTRRCRSFEDCRIVACWRNWRVTSA